MTLHRPLAAGPCEPGRAGSSRRVPRWGEATREDTNMTTLTIEKQFANAVADYISREMFPPHRGVIEVHNPFGSCRCLVAFGNDSYGQDERTRCYVDALLEELGRLDPVLGTDTEEGYTWAIVVPLFDNDLALFCHAALEHELYVRYRESRSAADDDGFVSCRKSICDREIMQHTGGEPLKIPGWESVN
jgi:hypothetical protein